MDNPIGYLSGPVDARNVYDHWKEGRKLGYFGTSYLTEYFQTIESLGLPGVVITSHPGEAYEAVRGNFRIINMPKTRGMAGWRYHVVTMRWLRNAVGQLYRHKCRLMLLTDARDYWFQLIYYRMRGVRFIGGVHCAIWPVFLPRSGSKRVLTALNKSLHFRFQDHVLSASQVISRQLTKLGVQSDRVHLFLPDYDRKDFEDIAGPDPSADRKTYRVLFAGRVVRNKGVFDLLDVAKILAGRHVRFHFAICGEGADLEPLRQAVRTAGLEDRVELLGFCERDALLEQFGLCDCVVVPTRRDFEEGFAMIVAEATLAGRPVVTSAVCPALEEVREAAIEVTPDDPQSYADALWSLATDAELTAEKRKGAQRVRERFFDKANSYGAKLELILQEMGLAKPERNTIPSD